MQRIREYYRLTKALLGLYVVDPIDVTFDAATGEVFPVVSKAGCSSVKLSLIRRYLPGFESRFPEIHHLKPGVLTDGKLTRHIFKNYNEYLVFCRGKKLVVVIREPAARFQSCYNDVISGRNVMYRYPSRLNHIVRFSPQMRIERFLRIVASIPDRIADRHFRSQSYYLRAQVIEAAQSVRIVDLQEFMSGQAGAEQIHLNAGERTSNPDDTGLFRTDLFRQRYAEDISLYEKVKKSPSGTLILK
nr:sulfotransferase family 2 domain-containing protein [Neolewinella aurantiaca]